MQSKYLSSHTKVVQCPTSDRPEYAFIGRSNVGKSSLINMLCNNSSLARISAQPGKTQTINFYDIDDLWYLVDLPGYGYARIAERTRKQWRQMVEQYLKLRHHLQCAFLLIDSCVPPQDKDIEFANWMGKLQIPFVIVFTKVDKKKSNKNLYFYESFEQSFLEYWNEMPQTFKTSSKTKYGREELLSFINDINAEFKAI